MVNSDELMGTTEYLTLYARCRISRCRYNQVRLYFLWGAVLYVLVITLGGCKAGGCKPSCRKPGGLLFAKLCTYSDVCGSWIAQSV